MRCSLDLGASLLSVRGYGTPEAKPLFERARDLALAHEQPLTEIVARGGLYTAEVMGGDQRRALDLAGDLLAMAGRFPLPMFVMIGEGGPGDAGTTRPIRGIVRIVPASPTTATGTGLLRSIAAPPS
jgi:hypothetical protein